MHEKNTQRADAPTLLTVPIRVNSVVSAHQASEVGGQSSVPRSSSAGAVDRRDLWWQTPRQEHVRHTGLSAGRLNVARRRLQGRDNR